MLTVNAYNDDYDPIDDIHIAAGVITYDYRYDGTTYILIAHKGLYFGSKMKHPLLNPNQLHHYGIVVKDNPYCHRGEALG